MKTLTFTLLLCLSLTAKASRTNYFQTNYIYLSGVSFTNNFSVPPFQCEPQPPGVTNLVLDASYTGTIQVGTNLFRLHGDIKTNLVSMRIRKWDWTVTHTNPDAPLLSEEHTNWLETSTNWTLVQP